MAIDFSAFDGKVDLDSLQAEVNNAKNTEFEDVPDGTYVVGIEKMELKETKKGDKLMFAVQFKIKEGDFAKRMIFFNRVICGNTSPKWTDGMAIKSVITWLSKLETDMEPAFVNYNDFAEVVLDIFQEVQDSIELEVQYNADTFNAVKILEVYDI